MNSPLTTSAAPVLILNGCALAMLRTLPDACVDAIVTSPPYWGLRDYGIEPTDWPACSYAPMPGLPAIQVPAERSCLGLEPTCDCADRSGRAPIVLDPFGGSGTTAQVALEHGRHAILIERGPHNIALIRKRLAPVLAAPVLHLA